MKVDHDIPIPQAQMQVRVPATLRRALRIHCTRLDVTMQAFVTAAVAEALSRTPEPAAPDPD